jgi:citrate lyase subunit beta/citryl-CoA lyase
MLFIPGNNPGMIQNAGILGADTIILDLEDAVSLSEKDSARVLVKKALETIAFGTSEMTVRINPLASAYGHDDLLAVAKAKPHAIVVPKADETQMIYISNFLDAMEDMCQYEKGCIKLIPLIESAQGVEKVCDVIQASNRTVAVLFGGEDYTADMGVRRTLEGDEISYARNRIAVACRFLGVAAIDTPFTDVDDFSGLHQDTLKGRNLGFTGKAAVNPRQIGPIHKALAPEQAEIDYALRILEALEIAENQGKGVFSLDGKMIDAPIIARARQTLTFIEWRDK